MKKNPLKRVVKLILNFFSRQFLLRISLILRPILRILYRGKKFVDPIDGSSYRTFLPYGYNRLRKNALCPGTLSLERHRLLWLYLKKKTKLLNEHQKERDGAGEQHRRDDVLPKETRADAPRRRLRAVHLHLQPRGSFQVHIHAQY